MQYTAPSLSFEKHGPDQTSRDDLHNQFMLLTVVAHTYFKHFMKIFINFAPFSTDVCLCAHMRLAIGLLATTHLLGPCQCIGWAGERLVDRDVYLVFSRKQTVDTPLATRMLRLEGEQVRTSWRSYHPLIGISKWFRHMLPRENTVKLYISL